MRREKVDLDFNNSLNFTPLSTPCDKEKNLFRKRGMVNVSVFWKETCHRKKSSNHALIDAPPLSRKGKHDGIRHMLL